MKNERLPALFVPHGAPTMALSPGEAGKALRAVSESLPKPKAVLIMTPHWVSPAPLVGVSDAFGTIHDFYGFPDELYEIGYPAKGDRALADMVVSLLGRFGSSYDDERGLDHGAWVPLRMMYPDADVPIVPLSVQPHWGTEGALEIGRALSPLLDEGVLLMGSGNVTHNLGDYGRAMRTGDVPEYVSSFPDEMFSLISAGNVEKVLDYRSGISSSVQAHPTDEHLLPLFFAWGASGMGKAKRFHTGVADMVISMDGYSFRRES